MTCTTPDVLHYLQGLLKAGKSPSTLRGMVAAINATSVGGNMLAEGDCSLISQFLKAAKRLTLRSRRLATLTWDLGLALAALRAAGVGEH